MRTLSLSLLGICITLAGTGSLDAQPSLREVLKDVPVADHWLIDDLPGAFRRAKETGKPILVVLRCVPCPPGRSLDQQVAQPTGELERLQGEFVCVRVIQTNGLDLGLFQYDYDQSWTAMFLNADRVIYGRYGTRTASGPGSDAWLGVPGFQKAMARALELHRGYPGNRARLAGKVGGKPDYPVPEKIPGLEDRPSKATTRQSCIHCHMVREFSLRAKWERGSLSGEDLFVYPMPDTIGMRLDREDGLRVQAVAPDSPAARAGVRAGDLLRSMKGQPLISLADVQWVLHTSPAEAEIPVTLLREGASLEKTLKVSGAWKESDIGWRASSWYGLRQGVKFEPLPAAERARRGLPEDGLALAVRGLFGKGGPKVQKAGLRGGDVIVAVDGKAGAMTESEFLVYLRLTHGPEDRVKLTVLRGTERRELDIPLW